MREIKAKRLYSHFKGKLYYVHDIVENTETGEEFVSYQALYGDYGNYIRPLDMFMEKVDINREDNIMNQNYRFEVFEGIIKK